MSTFKKLLPLLILMLFFSLSFSALAQQRISGTVTNIANKLPVPGASVQIKGTNRTLQTGIDGKFSIDASVGETLLITSVGFENYEVKVVSTNSQINAEMVTVASTLAEVVVVGYGTEKKVNLTGAVSVIKGEELVNRPTATLSQAMQGKVSGVNFNTGPFGFEPGAALNMQIRGQGTPFIVVDGIPTTSLNGINPNDVESISVLKDAAAAAIYGARAPYGVILITTKSGAANGKLTIEYAGNYSSIKPIRKPHHADSYTTALAFNEAAANSGAIPAFTNATIDRILAYQADPGLPETLPSLANPVFWANNTESNANYDWFNVYYGGGRRYQHNLSLSGGNKGVTFFLSGGLVDDDGVLLIGTDNYRRYNANAKFDASLTKWMKLTFNTRYYNTTRNTPVWDNQGNYEALFHAVPRTPPSQYMKSPNGVYSIQSKIPWARDAGNDNTIINDIVQRFATEITPSKGWTINADFTIQFTHNQFTSTNLTVYEDNVASDPVLAASTTPSFVAKSQDLNTYRTLNVYSTYKFEVRAKHHFSILAGYQQENAKFSQLSASRNTLITPAVPAITTATGPANANDDVNLYSTEGIFSRFNYNYDNRYLLELNGRYDGTYKFAEGKRWGFFPSISAGWNASNEYFWNNLKPYINVFKIRGAWGSLGNQLTAVPYQDLALLGTASNLAWLINGVRPSFTTAPNLVNPAVTWETSNTKNLGFDIGFLKNRLNITADIYQRRSFDQLGPAQAVPAVIGVASLPQSNNMETITKGWEFSLTWNDHIGKDFKYSVTAMLFDYKTTITKYNNPTGILSTSYAGQKQGEIWGFVSDGLIAEQAEANRINVGKIQQAISAQVWKTGDVRYMDLNKDGLITLGANTVGNPGDRKIIGNTTPRYQYGLTLQCEWKGFDFSMFWQGVAKRDLMLSGNMFWGFISGNQSSIFPGHLDYYRDADADKYKGLGKNTASYFPRPYLDLNMNAKNQVSQTRYLLNAAYARLKNMQVGYHMPGSILRKTKLQNIYVYMSGENLATITGMPEHFDPETANVGVLGNGKSYFSQSAITFGINLRF
jgi:TonB-linked SusC/RagA family outer membrane protein